LHIVRFVGLLLVAPPYGESVAFMYSQGMLPKILYSVLGGSLCRVCFVFAFCVT
jgi:hypothetical protein